jgi:hypothetical protein
MIGRLGGLALAWFAAFGTANWRDAGQDQAPAAPRADKFTHAQHVVRGWRSGATDDVKEEVWRDCRGCHDYTPERLVSAPQEHCDACHAPPGTPGRIDKDFRPGWEKDLAPYKTRTRDAFRHHTHLMLECRECHAPPPGVRGAAGDYDIVTGPGQCARCHERASLAADDFAQIRDMKWFKAAQDKDTAAALGMEWFTPPTPPTAEKHAEYAAKLVAVFGGPEGRLNVAPTALLPGGPFDHGDHVGMNCAACHDAIPTAAADATGVGDLAKRAAACKDCHVDRAGATLAVSPSRPEVRALHSLGAFAHADHYRFMQEGQQRRDGVANAAAYAALEKPGNASCQHCHVQDKAAEGNASPDHPFTRADGTPTGSGKNRYLDCIVCHDTPAWSTAETPQQPLHDSTDGVVDGKAGAAAGGFAACAECHGVGGKDFHAVPKVEVARIREQVFLFGGQTHPYIGMAGDDGRPQLQDCADCHRGRVPQLPSRLERRLFRHAPHLPAKPTAADCLQCHPSAGAATSSTSLADADCRTYSLASCAACHLGSQVIEAAAQDLAAQGKALAPLAAKTAAVAFDHQAHVGKQVACAECHELDAGAGRDIVTRERALDCTQCHDHDRTRGMDTKGAEIVFGEAVASCARCHQPARDATDRRADVPPRRSSPAAASDPRHQAMLASFGGFAAPQFHPIDRNCKECHTAELQPDPKWPGRRVPRDDHLFGKSTTPHKDQGSIYAPDACLRCHWSPLLDAETKYRGAVPRVGDPARNELRRQPGSKEARSKFGNDRRGYPGRDADG